MILANWSSTLGFTFTYAPSTAREGFRWCCLEVLESAAKRHPHLIGFDYRPFCRHQWGLASQHIRIECMTCPFWASHPTLLFGQDKCPGLTGPVPAAVRFPPIGQVPPAFLGFASQAPGSLNPTSSPPRQAAWTRCPLESWAAWCPRQVWECFPERQQDQNFQT